jgi:hypothetical protein
MPKPSNSSDQPRKDHLVSLHRCPSLTPPLAILLSNNIALLCRREALTFHTGDIVFARSGDKGGNANVGFWVRNPEAWPWLQSFLDSATFIKLMGKDWKPAYRVERFEFPNLLAVHFVTYGILQEGVSSSSILDGFAKSFGEFIRARVVDVPQKLLDDETQRRTERIKTAGWLKL